MIAATSRIKPSLWGTVPANGSGHCTRDTPIAIAPTTAQPARLEFRIDRNGAGRKLHHQITNGLMTASDGEGDRMVSAGEAETRSATSRDGKVVARTRARARRGEISPRAKKRLQMNTDRVLTFLQNARKENIPVRSGKWNQGEENYLRKLVQLFTAGVLDDVEPKTSMRAWLAKMLNCCPMRISKKQMHGENFKGKVKFRKNPDRIAKMTQSEFEEAWNDVFSLRASFLKHWAKEEFQRRHVCDGERTFDAWYARVLKIVPKPKLAMNDNLVRPKSQVQPNPGLRQVKQQLEAIRSRGQQKRARPSCNDTVSAQIPKRARTDTATVTDEAIDPSDEIAFIYDAACCPAAIHDDPRLDFQFNNNDLDESIEAQLQTTAGVNVSLASWSVAEPVKFAFIPELQEQGLDELYCDEALPPTSTDDLKLNFGVPSLWNVDEPFTDPVVLEPSGWGDDEFLLDDYLSYIDPALLTPYELPTDSWFYNVYSSCWPTLQL